MVIHRTARNPVDAPSLVRLNVPLVRLWGDPVADPAQGLHCITTHGEQLILRSLEHLKALGRRRVAILQMGGTVFRIDHAALWEQAFGKVLPKAEFVPALFSHEIIPPPSSYPTA